MGQGSGKWGVLSGYFGFREREEEEKCMGRLLLLLPLPRTSRGRRRPIVPFKTTLFQASLFFFLSNEECMKRCRFSQNASFHLNGNWRQNESDFKSILQFIRFSVWSLVLNFFNQDLNWPSNFNIYAIKLMI